MARSAAISAPPNPAPITGTLFPRNADGFSYWELWMTLPSGNVSRPGMLGIEGLAKYPAATTTKSNSRLPNANSQLTNNRSFISGDLGEIWSRKWCRHLTDGPSHVRGKFLRFSAGSLIYHNSKGVELVLLSRSEEKINEPRKILPCASFHSCSLPHLRHAPSHPHPSSPYPPFWQFIGFCLRDLVLVSITQPTHKPSSLPHHRQYHWLWRLR